MAYVYQHIRNDTGAIFYIGISNEVSNYYRSTAKAKRNPYWSNVVKKCGYSVEIIVDNITWAEACDNEINLISLYGRKNNDTGFLANMTDGGEGMRGCVFSPEMRRKIGLSKIGNKNCLGKKHSKESLEKYRIINTGANNPNYGKKMSDEQKDKIRQAMLGKKHSPETKLKMRLSALGVKQVKKMVV